MIVPDRLTCEHVFRQLDDYLDRRLNDEEMRLVREHLQTCAFCASMHLFESTVIGAVREKLQRIDVPADLRERLRARLAHAASDPPDTS